MSQAAVRRVFEAYFSKLIGAIPLERAKHSSGKTFELHAVCEYGVINYEFIIISPSGGEQKSPFHQDRLAEAIDAGRPYLPTIFRALGCAKEAVEVEGAGRYDTLPGVMATFQTEHGTASLLLPENNAMFTLKIRVKKPGENPIKDSIPVDPRIISAALRTGVSAIRGAFDAHPEAAALLEANDYQLQQMREAEILAEATKAQAPRERDGGAKPKAPRV